jgi:hypothetical protein
MEAIVAGGSELSRYVIRPSLTIFQTFIYLLYILN